MRRQFVTTAMTAVVSAVFLATSSGTAGASSITPAFTLQTVAGANVGCVPSGNGPTGCPNINGDRDGSYQVAGPNGGAGLVSVSDLTDAFTDPYFTYSAQADAGFGELHAKATGSFDLSTADYRAAFAGAFSTDQLTITAPGQSGAATLQISVLLDGFLQSTGFGGAAVLAGVTAGPDQDPFGQNNQFQGYDGTNPPATPMQLSVAFDWGQPFYLSMILVTGVGTQMTCLACNSGDAALVAVTGAGTATADFYNTLTLTGLVPIVNGIEIRDAQFSSASGTQYSVDGLAPVPEPGSLLLLGGGLAAALRRCRRASETKK